MKRVYAFLALMAVLSAPLAKGSDIAGKNDIQALAKKYDAINIKLDKAGGLTHSLLMMDEAKRAGLSTMVGCMVAGSLSMAPALLLGQVADLIDLDGPLWLERDVPHKLRYTDGMVSPPSRELWG